MENHYNNAKEWADRIRSGQNLAHTYLEKPAIYKMTGDVRGKDILCIACGTGEECAYLMEQGARSVVGIDASESFIQYARESYPDITFEAIGFENMQARLAGQKFDIVFSSLGMHYLKDWEPTLRTIRSLFRDEQSFFVCSTHHPVYWGVDKIKTETQRSRLMGYVVDLKTNGITCYGDYLSTHKTTDTWFQDMVVEYYHRPLGDIFRDIKNAQFVMVDFQEPKPLAELEKFDRNACEVYSRFPIFMLLKLQSVSKK